MESTALSLSPSRGSVRVRIPISVGELGVYYYLLEPPAGRERLDGGAVSKAAKYVKCPAPPPTTLCPAMEPRKRGPQSRSWQELPLHPEAPWSVVTSPKWRGSFFLVERGTISLSQLFELTRYHTFLTYLIST